MAGYIFPNTMIITTTIPTLKYLMEARKSAIRNKKSVPWQGALTVSLTAVVYCLTILPMGVYFIGHSFVDQNNYGFHLLLRYGAFLGMANISSNFFIYSLTITSFRRYLLSKIKMTFRSKQKTGNSKRICDYLGRETVTVNNMCGLPGPSARRSVAYSLGSKNKIAPKQLCIGHSYSPWFPCTASGTHLVPVSRTCCSQ